jgi:hypothetical protein
MKMDQAPTLTNRLHAEQVLALFQNLALGVIGAASGALVLASAMIHLGVLDWIKGVSWILYIFACAAAHLLLRYFYFSSNRTTTNGKFGQFGSPRSAWRKGSVGVGHQFPLLAIVTAFPLRCWSWLSH